MTPEEKISELEKRISRMESILFPNKEKEGRRKIIEEVKREIRTREEKRERNRLARAKES